MILPSATIASSSGPSIIWLLLVYGICRDPAAKVIDKNALGADRTMTSWLVSDPISFARWECSSNHSNLTRGQHILQMREALLFIEQQSTHITAANYAKSAVGMKITATTARVAAYSGTHGPS